MTQGNYTEKIIRTKPREFLKRDPKRDKTKFKQHQKNRDYKRQLSEGWNVE